MKYEEREVLLETANLVNNNIIIQKTLVSAIDIISDANGINIEKLSIFMNENLENDGKRCDELISKISELDLD